MDSRVSYKPRAIRLQDNTYKSVLVVCGWVGNKKTHCNRYELVGSVKNREYAISIAKSTISVYEENPPRVGGGQNN